MEFHFEINGKKSSLDIAHVPSATEQHIIDAIAQRLADEMYKKLRNQIRLLPFSDLDAVLANTVESLFANLQSVTQFNHLYLVHGGESEHGKFLFRFEDLRYQNENYAFSFSIAHRCSGNETYHLLIDRVFPGGTTRLFEFDCPKSSVKRDLSHALIDYFYSQT